MSATGEGMTWRKAQNARNRSPESARYAYGESLRGRKRGLFVVSEEGRASKSEKMKAAWAEKGAGKVSVAVAKLKERGAQMAGPARESEGEVDRTGRGAMVKVLDGSEFAACMPSRKYLAAYQPGARGERVAVRSVLAFAEWEDVGCRDWLVGKILKAAAMRPGDFVPGEQVLPEVGRERAGFFLRAGFGAGEAALLGTA